MLDKWQISAEDTLRRKGLNLLDVRAEVEFGAGHLPESLNVPLLTTAERHEVGVCYKTKGQDEAIRLGHELVGPHKEERLASWMEYLRRWPEPVLTCFRGGLRSEITQRWLSEAGLQAFRVKGGYKALRRELLREWEKPLEGFVITGLTGSAKTAFLRGLAVPGVIDLEALAVHRGSAFGGLFQPQAQPAQQTFENALALELLRRRPGPVLLEDESRLVGRCVIPPQLFAKMQVLPRIFLVSTDAERVAHILEVYVREPLRTREPQEVMGELITALRAIRNRLGGQEAAEVEALVRQAFASKDPEAHTAWIERLLHGYYDGLYSYAMTRADRTEPVFRGTAEECRAWLAERLPISPSP